ncbi:hypothetical protein Xen7305DRAFT_00017180 [Xenococcus sp. PCC 7305]|uniref:DUF4278 domain-containing protein n=1 Tax=Xenococcus sp. PCC 7305 TaxID=102125 RepID=UPI0002ABB48A|nr:DUF4278 domain-containing protein [Xenococcus sp. PCC 7305]ELS02008.1 hypothetical protein Xen7305DRAFT_00017180 [Xenococcus sp. PCC 7305]
MKLVYRGVSYDYDPPQVAVTESKITGKFRGLDWRFHNLKKPLVLQPPVNLTYRGVAYSNRPTSGQEQSAAEANIREQARYRLMRKEKAIHNRAASMFVRTAHEVGLV